MNGRERICWDIIICPSVRLRVAYKQKTHTKCKNMLLTSVHRRLWVGKFVFCSINPNESLRPKKRVSQIGNIIESKENGFSSLEKGTLFRKPWRRMKKIVTCVQDPHLYKRCALCLSLFVWQDILTEFLDKIILEALNFALKVRIFAHSSIMGARFDRKYFWTSMSHDAISKYFSKREN